MRKLLILDLSSTDAARLFALSAAILALGGVYWLVRHQDRRERVFRRRFETQRPAGSMTAQPPRE